MVEVEHSQDILDADLIKDIQVKIKDKKNTSNELIDSAILLLFW